MSSSDDEPLERGQLLGREVREVLRVLQPLQDLVGDVVERALDALEDAREDAVVGVEVGLALHQAGARQVIEAEQARAVQAALQRLEERHPLLHRDRDAFVAQPVEEVEEHRLPSLLIVARAELGPGRRVAAALGVEALQRLDVLLLLEERAEERDVRLELVLA